MGCYGRRHELECVSLSRLACPRLPRLALSWLDSLTLGSTHSVAVWNADNECCGAQAVNAVDDIGFVKQVIDNMVADVKTPVTIEYAC